MNRESGTAVHWQGVHVYGCPPPAEQLTTGGFMVTRSYNQAPDATVSGPRITGSLNRPSICMMRHWTQTFCPSSSTY